MGLANSPASGGDYHRPMRRKLAPRQKTSSAYSAHTAFHRPAISLALSATCNSKLARSFTSGRRSADRRESDDAKSQYSQCSCAAPASRFLEATYWGLHALTPSAGSMFTSANRVGHRMPYRRVLWALQGRCRRPSTIHTDGLWMVTRDEPGTRGSAQSRR